MYKVLFSLLAIAALAFALTACGDDDDDDDDDDLGDLEEEGDDDVDDDEGGDEPESRVNVSLVEFSLTADPTSTAAGDVTFVATNDGAEEHELAVFRTDLAAEELPTNDDGSVDEGADELEEVGEIEGLDPGDEESFSEELEPGNYVLICNIVEEEDDETEAHYALGMRAGFTVE